MVFFCYCICVVSCDHRLIVLSFRVFERGIRGSWQCAISCVIIYRARWRLENSREMAGGVQHVHSGTFPTHTLTMTRCLQYLQAPTQQKLLIQASSCTSPHRATHTDGDQKRRSKRSVIFTYILGVSQELHFECFRFEEGGSAWPADISHTGWGHRSSSLCPPSDVVLHTIRPFTRPQNKVGLRVILENL